MTTRLGIIGAGIMGERMLRAALEHAQGVVDVAAVWDAAPAALDRLAPLLPARAPSAAAVIAASDCVYVATPPGTHLSYADEALSAGRAVFLEKPLATDVAAATAFARRTDGARVAVNFPFASSFAAERLRAWLDAGAVGTPAHLAIHVAFRTWPRPWQQAASAWLDAPAEGGFTREVVSHFLFLARRLLGPLRPGHATVRPGHATVRPGPPGHAERAVTAVLHAGPVPVALDGAVGTTDADDHNTWTLSRTAPGNDHAAIRLRDWSIAERQAPAGTWDPDPGAAPNERMRPLVLRRQLEAVARMTHGEPHPLATVAEALEVQAAIEGILHA